MWAACMNRDSDRYGVTDPGELTRRDYAQRARDENKAGIALCKTHAAIIEGRQHRAAPRDLPRAWRKLKTRNPCSRSGAIPAIRLLTCKNVVMERGPEGSQNG